MTIGGTLGARELALLHRPKTREEMHAAVREMAARGLSDYSIASATGLSIEIVRRLIGELHRE